MATTFDLFYLGVAPQIDTVEGNLTSENHTALNGQVFGSALAPVSSTLTSLSPAKTLLGLVDSYTGGATSSAYDSNNFSSNEQFIIGGVTYTHDATMRYTNSVITYTDGTTAIVEAIVMQDTNGNLYLIPPPSGPNTYSAALEAKPILSVTLGTAAPANGTDVFGMTADRYDLTLSDYMVEGTAGNDLINAAYLGDPEGDRIDDTDNLAGTNDDLVFAGAGNDTVRAGAGNDTVYGEDGNDLLDGGAGNDLLQGGNGNDTLIGGAGADTMIGGVGLDIVDYSTSGAAVTVDLAAGTATGGDATGDVINQGIDGIIGSAYDDTLIGSDASSTSGTDIYTTYIDGGAGNDFIDGRNGGDSLLGGTGSDTILGGGGNDLIDGGADGDWLDGGDGTDTIFGGAGDDTILVAGDNDSIFGGDGADLIHATALNLSGIRNFTVDGGSGGVDNDTLDLSELIADGWVITGMTQNAENNGNPGFSGQIQLTRGFEGATINYTDIENLILTNSDYIVEGTAGADLIDASYAGDPEGDKIDNLDHSDGSNADSVLAGAGNDTIVAGAGNDTVLGESGAEVIFGGEGDDSLFGGAENDTIAGDAGNDHLFGEGGDDRFTLQNGFGADTITGGETDETAGDTLDLSGVTGPLTLNLSNAVSESGTVSDGTATASFSEIENILLGAGTDTLVLADGSGSDAVTGFTAPTDTGNGTYTSGDLLDVSGLTSDGTTPVTTADVTVTDTNGDGTGDAILTFPNGENLTLIGVPMTDVDSTAALVAMGIPDARDFVIEGSAGADLINVDYTGDPEGDRVDAGDAANGSQDDVIFAGAGSDSIDSGLGNDLINAGAGDDEIFLDGSLQNDTIIGGETEETVSEDDRINFSAISDGLLINFTAPETGTITDGTSVTEFSEIERFQMGTGADTVIGSDGVEEIIGNYGDDSILAGGGNDTIFSGFDNDYVDGGAGDDSILSSSGADTVSGGAGNDQIDLGPGDGETDLLIFSDGDGADVVSSFEIPIDNGDGTFTGRDQLDVSNLTDAAGNPVNVADVTVGSDGSGNAVLSFPNGESITLVGVDPASVSSHDALAAMGIFQPDYIVQGTAGDDVIDASYSGDPQGDQIDNADSRNNDNADVIDAGAGNDVIMAGLGADTIFGGAGNDTVSVGQGDSVQGGDGDDFFTLTDTGETETGAISILGGEGDETIGDTLWLGETAKKSDITFSNSDDATGGLSGSFAMVNGTVVTFSEIENIICFTPGARILTQWGERPVESLRLGDMVVTRDHGLQPVRWVGKRTVAGLGDFAPISVASSVMGGRDALLVSPQHRLLFTGYQAELLFGESEVLIAAKHMVNGRDVTVSPCDEVTYIHVMFDRHEIIFADGLGTESFYAGDMALTAVDAAAREELFAIFPELRSAPGQHRDTVRPCLRRHEAQLLCGLGEREVA
ncbi:MAG: hypothetical protein VR71_06125 [Roseovarius sp. BRH_c41]|uniref:Hint domain-containing protein n=1 Tax=Roseovarius sp. BRH_c41 TaxID=1629709 RepID=UPI0005F0FF67|nr:Hint domain-containing protein [Roseovarius sp. BRH_c41]KJS41260.1 MAG: hypothetical protein VR71_19410 [Roseovarius sp. BRH_c41]KJS44472.1 MAG: hypothetical protein VR71_06125 [Roseovarius sp. BRH_c41]